MRAGFATPDGRGTSPRTDDDDWKERLSSADVRDGRLHGVRHTAGTVLLILSMDQDLVALITAAVGLVGAIGGAAIGGLAAARGARTGAETAAKAKATADQVRDQAVADRQHWLRERRLEANWKGDARRARLDEPDPSSTCGSGGI
ncbi:integrase [Streptomyces albus]|uniref:Integrase n=1 Tax=Streptomyces albus (strain ATCC 21838 / DSM 41398 / FERM P-419 / JCM 4703 / NBRC 107858) TaxID=1081613 RepID=A0A0B5F005_STRA4|nr:integrase [Streptomyces albus]AOU78508.1 integrase [Streptomyces albus]